MKMSQSIFSKTSFEWLKSAFKFFIVIVVFWFLIHKGLVTKEGFNKLTSAPEAFSLCIFLILLNTLLGTVRWALLLSAQNVDPGFKEVTRLNLIGIFFNIALPGAVSGDVVKAITIGKLYPTRRSHIFGSILFDRILGVSALVFVAAGSAGLSHTTSLGSVLSPALLKSVMFSGALVLGFFIYLFASTKKDPLHFIFKQLALRYQRLGSIQRIYEGIIEYRNHPKTVFISILLSLLIHLLLVTIAFLVFGALSSQPVSFAVLAVIVPIGLLATAIPVLPAGVGTGHAAFIALFSLIGSNQGAEVFSWIVFFQILLGAVGGVVYLKRKA